jgi:3-hydroxyisobutyrate dehydrogenase
MATVAVLGTGIMGAPMARNLLRAGHDVRVWNRTADKAAPLGDEGATVAATPVEAVEGADVLLTMLGDATAVQEALVESGALDVIGESTLWIQSSTIGVAATDKLVELCGDRGVPFVDAPVLGSRKPAEDGQLVVLASGPDDARERCEPVFAALAGRTIWAGEAGCGTRLKLVANSWILCTIENLAETFVFARTLGLDPRRFLEAISGGGMDMSYAHLKGEAMLAEEFPASFPLRHARKDAALVLEAAGELDLPLVRATLAQFDRALELGHGDEDMGAVYYATADRAGVAS